MMDYSVNGIGQLLIHNLKNEIRFFSYIHTKSPFKNEEKFMKTLKEKSKICLQPRNGKILNKESLKTKNNK